MNNIHACVLGCTNPEGVPYRAAPGQLACHTCADRLRDVLNLIGATYATITEPDRLTPGGTNDGLRAVPGPRSPAVDAILIHTDPRSRPDTGQQVPALAAVEQWARLVREDRSVDTPPERMLATVPAGRVTMTRELATLQFHLDWVLAQPWLLDFAVEMRDVLRSLRAAGRLLAPTLTIGRCPIVVVTVPLRGGAHLDLTCDAALRVRVGDDVVRCRNCGTIWPRGRWEELGDQWIDYARLSAELGVGVPTLRRWCSEDRWVTSGTARRRLVSRRDARVSYKRRRGTLPLGEAG